MKEKACLREVPSQLNAASRPNKDKAQATQGDSKVDHTKKIKTGHTSPKVGDIKCYDVANPTARIRLLPLPTLITGPQPCAPFYRDGSQCRNRDD